MPISEDKVRAYKKFANKIWNITRFVLASTEDYAHDASTPLTPHDTQLLADLSTLTTDITKDIEGYRLYLAAEKLYHFVWHTFADTILEESKPRLAGNDEKEKASCQKMLYTTLTTSLSLLHPFMPFITEEIWQSLPHRDTDLLMVSPWPTKID
jgi:valyl-tRNA synthetase